MTNYIYFGPKYIYILFIYLLKTIGGGCGSHGPLVGSSLVVVANKNLSSNEKQNLLLFGLEHPEMDMRFEVSHFYNVRGGN